MENTSETVQNAVSMSRRGRPVDPNSGLSRARQVFASLPTGTTRKQAIAAFQGIGLAKDTSAAYYSVIKRSTR